MFYIFLTQKFSMARDVFIKRTFTALKPFLKSYIGSGKNYSFQQKFIEHQLVYLAACWPTNARGWLETAIPSGGINYCRILCFNFWGF